MSHLASFSAASISYLNSFVTHPLPGVLVIEGLRCEPKLSTALKVAIPTRKLQFKTRASFHNVREEKAQITPTLKQVPTYFR